MKLPEAKQLPSGNWCIRLRLGGQNVSVTRPTKSECENTARIIKSEYKLNKRTEATTSATLSQAIDRYIDARTNVLSPSTIRGYKAHKASRFQAYMQRPIKSIDWQKMINTEASLCSPKTLKNAWGLVRSAISEYDINPTIRLPAPVPHEKEWLTPEQIPVFIEAVKGKPVEIGALLALSGLRRSEIYGLTWDDIDLDKKVIHIHQSKLLGEKAKPVIRKQNKTASSTRDVPIFIDGLFSALCAVPDKSGYVMTENIGTLRKRITKVCEEANLPDIGVHGLRHSFCSLCYSLGVSELACMKLGGWSDYQTMRKIYTHLSEADAVKSTEKLMEFFGKNNADKNADANPQSTGAESV